MEERPPGRPPGYHHSEETRQKIKESLAGRTKSIEHRKKISAAMKGQEKSKEHREKLSQLQFDYEADHRMLYIDNLCLDRLAELKAIYPDQAEFFEENETALLIALRDVKSDKELDDIRKYIETENIDRYVGTLSYQYSSFPSHEDVLIDLLDEYHKQIQIKKYH